MHRGRHETRHQLDEGFTLIEVVVALGLFLVMSASVLSVLGSAITTTKDDKSRLEATNLASRELEIVRDIFSSVTRGPDKITENAVANPDPLPGGIAGQPLVVDGVPYTVTRTARWEPIGTEDATLSPCDQGSSSELAYLHVKVAVKWPALGDRPPLTMDTVMTPPKGTYSTLDGHIGLKVIDSDGKPKSGVTVTAKKGALTEIGVTATDGCVLLAHVEAGDWALTAQAPNFVNRSGDPTASTVAHVQSGQLWRGSIEYDQAATITATIKAPEGYDLPSGVTALPLTLGNSALQPIGMKAVPGTGPTRTIEHLWAYPSGYALWVGGCEDGNPALTGGSLPVSTPRGANTAATVMLGAVEIQATPGTQVVATHASDRLCSTTTTIQLGTTQAAALPQPDPTSSPTGSPTASPTSSPTSSPTADPTSIPTSAPSSGGVLRVGLPYGTWTIGGNVISVGPGDPVVVVL